MGGLIILMLIPMMGIMYTIWILEILLKVYLVYAVIVALVSLAVFLVLRKKGMFTRYAKGWKQYGMKALQIFLIFEMAFYCITFILAAVALALLF